MKLLGLRLCEHDSNISYFDGQKVHYLKSERLHQIKHHGYDNLWEYKNDIKRGFEPMITLISGTVNDSFDLVAEIKTTAAGSVGYRRALDALISKINTNKANKVKRFENLTL